MKPLILILASVVVLALALPSPAAAPSYLSPTALAATAGGQLLYVACATAGKVVVVDTTTRKIARTIAVLDSPVGLALAPDGETATSTPAVSPVRSRPTLEASTLRCTEVEGAWQVWRKRSMGSASAGGMTVASQPASPWARGCASRATRCRTSGGQAAMCAASPSASPANSARVASSKAGRSPAIVDMKA